ETGGDDVPQISSIAPNEGPSTGGTTVVITGTNLDDVTTITFGGVDATSFTIDSPTQITAVTPAHAPGDVPVRLSTGTSISNELVFTYLDTHIYKAFAPNSSRDE